MLEAAASWDPADVQLRAANGKLTGEKLFVPDAAVADSIVVVARDGVYVVDAKSRRRQHRADVGDGPHAKVVHRHAEGRGRREAGECGGTSRAG